MGIPVESFFLAPGGQGSLQHRLRQMVTEGILSGRFRPGDRMPSTRALAAHLGVARITVTLAYADLVASDYLLARGRSGTFVSSAAPDARRMQPLPREGQSADWARLLHPRAQGLPRPDRPRDWSVYRYPFIYGQADPTLFDHQNWRACALQALGLREFHRLSADCYDEDDPMLVEYILRHILPRRGIAAVPSEVLITMGAQNGLWLAAQVLLGPGERAVMENPGYPGTRAVLGTTGAEVVSVDVDDHGLPPERLPDRPKLVVTTASHHCPTNATLPLERRLDLLAAAEAGDFLILEDDYEFEMSFLHSAAPSLKSLDAGGRVVHVGSFSKSLFPGLRLGYLVAPAPLIAAVRALRATVLRHPPGQLSRTLALFLSLGHYDALVARMKAAYRLRREVMTKAIEDNGLQIAGQGGFGGSSFWMQAPGAVDTEDLALRLRAEGVLIEPGRVFFDPARERRNFYRLAYSSIGPAAIPEGIARIARALG